VGSAKEFSGFYSPPRVYRFKVRAACGGKEGEMVSMRLWGSEQVDDRLISLGFHWMIVASSDVVQTEI